MKSGNQVPTTIDECITLYLPNVGAILLRVRETIRETAPDAEEKNSDRMPSFALNGALVYFGGFKAHVGFFPPVGNAQIQREVAPYAGEKGNLQFQRDEPIF